MYTKFGVLQGLNLGPLLFLRYVNFMVKTWFSNIKCWTLEHESLSTSLRARINGDNSNLKLSDASRDEVETIDFIELAYDGSVRDHPCTMSWWVEIKSGAPQDPGHSHGESRGWHSELRVLKTMSSVGGMWETLWDMRLSHFRSLNGSLTSA